jgi:hypothetical protein
MTTTTTTTTRPRTHRRTPGSPRQEALIARLLATKVHNADRAAQMSTRTLIDYLIGCEDKTGYVRPLTAGQDGLVRRLATEDFGSDPDAEVAAVTALPAGPARNGAIDNLLTWAKIIRRGRQEADALMREAAQQLPVNHGYVLADGRYARTYAVDGKRYVKVLTDSDVWEKLPDGARLVLAEGARPITLADAAIIAGRTHTCGHCGRAIETEASLVTRSGVGPVCFDKF